MKKFLLMIALLGSSLAYADMYFDAHTNKFLTYRDEEGVDQEEYHCIVLDFLTDMHTYVDQGLTDVYIWNIANVRVHMKLQYSDSLAAQAFLRDIKKFADFHAFIRVTGSIS